MSEDTEGKLEEHKARTTRKRNTTRRKPTTKRKPTAKAKPITVPKPSPAVPSEGNKNNVRVIIGIAVVVLIILAVV